MDKTYYNSIEQLRKRSNADLSECKKALGESKNNLRDAIIILKRKGFVVKDTAFDKISGILITIGLVLLIVSAIAPGVINIVAPPELNTLAKPEWLIISIISGGVSILMITRSLAWIIGGIVICGSSFALFWVYFFILFDKRETFFKMEFAIPVILALILGLTVSFVLEKIFKPEKKLKKSF